MTSMNKIFRKCRDFGLMVRLKDISYENSLSCVKELIKGNIPLCVIDLNMNRSLEVLKNIAFNADLFIAVENVKTIEDAYSSVAYGAQFFILGDFNLELMRELTNSGFFFIPTVNNKNELDTVIDMGIECIISGNTDLTLDSKKISVVKDHGASIGSFNNDTLFNIVNIDNSTRDYENWINSIVKEMIGLNYTEVIFSSDTKDPVKLNFGDLFASTNKCKIGSGKEDTLVLECKNIKLAINYLKWREIYIDPDRAVVLDGNVVEGPLDKKMGGFTILLKEKPNEYN